jgi:hypothetical protein
LVCTATNTLIGTGASLAVGSLPGLLSGPMGMAIGAVTGTLAGALFAWAGSP